MALILNCNINYMLHLKKPTFSNCTSLRFLSFQHNQGLYVHLICSNSRTADIVFGRKSFPPIRCSVSRRVHFQTFPSIDLTTNGWSFYSYTTDLVNNAEECERRPGKSACWGKILFYDVCKWQSSFSLQSKIVFWLTLIRARTDCTVR